MPIFGYGENMTALYVLEIDPETILIRMRVDISRWHIIDVDRELTWCGQFLSQGGERRPRRDARRSPLRDLRASVRIDEPSLSDLTAKGHRRVDAARRSGGAPGGHHRLARVQELLRERRPATRVRVLRSAGSLAARPFDQVWSCLGHITPTEETNGFWTPTATVSVRRGPMLEDVYDRNCAHRYGPSRACHTENRSAVASPILGRAHF